MAHFDGNESITINTDERVIVEFTDDGYIVLRYDRKQGGEWIRTGGVTSMVESKQITVRGET